VRSLERYIHATASQLYKNNNGQELALIKKKAFVKDREGVSQKFHPSMHGMVLKIRWLHFPCFHMSELLFIDMSMFVFTSIVPLTGCFIWARRHRSGHAYRAKRKQRKRASPSCICVIVFIPSGIIRDEWRGYIMRGEK
jgi:hypothetical protein